MKVTTLIYYLYTSHIPAGDLTEFLSNSTTVQTRDISRCSAGTGRAIAIICVGHTLLAAVETDGIGAWGTWNEVSKAFDLGQPSPVFQILVAQDEQIDCHYADTGGNHESENMFVAIAEPIRMWNGVPVRRCIVKGTENTAQKQVFTATWKQTLPGVNNWVAEDIRKPQ